MLPFGKHGIIAETPGHGRYGRPELEELPVGMAVEESVDLILALEREIHPAEQVVVGIVARDSGFEQCQRGAHDADAAPGDAQPRLDEADGRVAAAAGQRIGPEGCLPVDVDVEVVAGIIEKFQQFARLVRTGVDKEEICVFVPCHDAQRYGFYRTL